MKTSTLIPALAGCGQVATPDPITTPGPAASLTFSPNPITPGAAATGTLTLSEPAVEDTDIPLNSSNPQVATVPPSVTVSRGQTSVTFTVQTNSTGGGTPSGAVITPIYGKGTGIQLNFTK